ncbi:3405_t:CDS:2, partial [Racocetra persica]
TSSGNFIDLYNVLIKAEEQVETTNQEVIRSYFAFGKKLKESSIGEDKIQQVKSYSALRISKLSWDEIDAIEKEFE